MEMTFDFGRATESPTSLPDALAAIASGKPLSDGHALQGHVHLTGDGPSISFYDDLQMLVLNLSVHAPKELAEQGRADVHMVSWNKVYVLLKQGGEIVVVERDDDVGDIELGRYPAQAWLAAVRDGGRRFAEFVDRLLAVEPQWQALSEMLHRELA